MEAERRQKEKVMQQEQKQEALEKKHKEQLLEWESERQWYERKLQGTTAEMQKARKEQLEAQEALRSNLEEKEDKSNKNRGGEEGWGREEDRLYAHRARPRGPRHRARGGK